MAEAFGVFTWLRLGAERRSKAKPKHWGGGEDGLGHGDREGHEAPDAISYRWADLARSGELSGAAPRIPG